MSAPAGEPDGPTSPSSTPPTSTERWWKAGKVVVLVMQGLACTATIVGVLVSNGCGPT